MSNLESNNLTLKETQRETLLREFEKVAIGHENYSLLHKIASLISQWMSLNVTQLLQRIGYNRKKINSLKGEKVILNIGCYQNTNNSYVNADLFPSIYYILKLIQGEYKFGNDLFINICFYDRSLLGFADSIILSHVLEHIPPKLAITALKNCFAYLKQDGCIRVSVPYLGAYDQPNLIPPCQGIQNRLLAKNNLIYHWGHQFMYDVELLTVLMEEAGFSEVKEVTFGKGILGETDVPGHQAESIYLTGVKI